MLDLLARSLMLATLPDRRPPERRRVPGTKSRELPRLCARPRGAGEETHA
jgi:hypothetical protein